MTNPPKLKQKLEVKKYHGNEVKDEFSWVHQKNILEVLKDSSKLNPEVRNYLKKEKKQVKKILVMFPRNLEELLLKHNQVAQ